MPIAVPPPPAPYANPSWCENLPYRRVSDPCNRYSAVVTICRRQAKGIQHMSRHREAQKSCREHYCQNHNRDHLLHQVISIKHSNSTFDFYCYLRNEHPALAKNSQAATIFTPIIIWPLLPRAAGASRKPLHRRHARRSSPRQRVTPARGADQKDERNRRELAVELRCRIL
jgi:hypothetical protein